MLEGLEKECYNLSLEIDRLVDELKVAQQENEQLKQEKEVFLKFIKVYYTNFLVSHERGSDISHNDQFFIYCDANKILSKSYNREFNGAPVMKKNQYGIWEHISDSELINEVK